MNSKPTFWAFGDSFSEEVTSIPKENARWDYVNQFLDGVPYKTWLQIISEKLNYNYENRAASSGVTFDVLGGGNSNDQMFLNVCEFASKFKKDDLVFLGFTHPGRFQVYLKETDSVRSVNPHDDFGENTEIFNKLYYQRSSPYYVHDIIQRFKLLETLSKLVGFKIFYWDWTGMFFELYENINKDKWITPIIDNEKTTFTIYLQENNINFNSIYLETGGKIEDHHWGKVFSEHLSELLYPQILERIKN